MTSLHRSALIFVALILSVAGAMAQTASRLPKTAPVVLREDSETPDSLGFAFLPEPDSAARARLLTRRLSDLREPVFGTYRSRPFPSSVAAPRGPLAPQPEWLRAALFADSLAAAVRQRYMIDNPRLVRFNEASLPDPPKTYRLVLDPSTLEIAMEEVPSKPVALGAARLDIKRANWLHEIDCSLQFSQAYISPNWYQGGNNALSMISNASWSVKLNQAYHPNLLFENYIGWKLSLTSTPDDSLRNYSVTEDIFQVITKAGIKAHKHWFYSLSLNFKTQFLNSYPTNSPDLAAGFLSPGELNLGLGMTFDLTTADKRFTITASLSPLSYNLKTCISDRIDHSTFGISQRHHAISRIGSSTETTASWKVTRDITWQSRLFGFTDYTDAQLDWEHTIDFAINRFLSTRLYMHLRYDSTTPRYEDSRWHQWQFKEILSLGFAYKLSTI